MKKIFLFLITLFCLIGCSKTEEHKKFYPCEVNNISVFDGRDSIVNFNVSNSICLYNDTNNTVNNLFTTKENYEFMWRYLVMCQQYECKYPRTYTPEKALLFNVTDTLYVTDSITNDTINHIYICKTLLKGYCKNGFGVESEISSSIDFGMYYLKNDSLIIRIIDVFDY